MRRLGWHPLKRRPPVPRGLLCGAFRTSTRVCGRRLRTASICPFCRAAHEDEGHIIWDCLRWCGARSSWSPWLLAAAADLPHLGPPEHWPACLRRACVLPSHLSKGRDRVLGDTLLYCLYSMHLAVLAERMAACSDKQGRQGWAVSAGAATGSTRPLSVG